MKCLCHIMRYNRQYQYKWHNREFQGLERRATETLVAFSAKMVGHTIKETTHLHIALEF